MYYFWTKKTRQYNCRVYNALPSGENQITNHLNLQHLFEIKIRLKNK